MERILSYEQALTEVLAHAALLGPRCCETVSLLEGLGRVFARQLVADRDQPPFARATRDGFAVRSADLAQGSVPLRLLGTVRAGQQWSGPLLQSGETIEIMTGAPVPAGADAVLMLEHASLLQGDSLQPDPARRLQPGENIVAAGAEASAGTALVPPGRRIATPEIGLAASCGLESLEVFARPAVAIVPTGDELVSLSSQPFPWQIRDSNSYTLASLVAAEGAIPLRLPVAGDTRAELQARLNEAAPADLILFSGGVSMGKYDLVEAVLHEAGAEFLFTGALIQPGKPVVFGRLPRAPGARSRDLPTAESWESANWTYFFGLPGNPLSTEVCFRLFVAPLLRCLEGETRGTPRFAEAELSEEVRGGARVTRFLPALLESDWSAAQVRPVPWHGSGDLASSARANVFMVLPLGVDTFRVGDRVRVLLR